MLRLSESRFKYGLVCFAVFWLGLVRAQDPLGDLLPANSQLWKSFQEEMKTLEQAAHRVNTLLSERVAHHVRNSAPDDQEARPSDNTPEATVLASPDDIKDGMRTKPEESKPEETTKIATDNLSQDGGLKQTLKPHFSLGSFMNSFGFFNNLPEPWWKGKNVCVQKSEKVEEKHKDEEKDGEKHVLIMGTGTFEHCKQTSGKYICTTVISTPQQTKTLSTTYQCCEGFRRQAEGCVEGEEPAPSLNPYVPPSPAPYVPPSPTPMYNRDAVSIIDMGRSVEDKSSYSSQYDDIRDETLERWRKFNWDRFR